MLSGPILKTRLYLIEKSLRLLAKFVLIPLLLSATDAAIHKKMFQFVRTSMLASCLLSLASHMTTLIISLTIRFISKRCCKVKQLEMKQKNRK